MIELKNVWKGYGKNNVVKGVTFTVKEGSIHGLIGENSAGKTTLIKTIMGIYKPDSGEVLFDGKPIYDNPEVKAKVGYVADSNEYIPAYTVKGMRDFFKRIYPTFDQEYFTSLNEIFQLNLKKSVGSLSKGQKMRLAFMLNISWHPKYLVMDEPTSGIDPQAKKDLLEVLVNEVEHWGMTVLISSHHLGEIETICDHITMMKEGALIVNDELVTAKENYVKVQIVFKNGLPKGFSQWPEVIQISNVGSIYNVVLSNYDEQMNQKIMEAGADFVEALDVSLEEMFLFANQEEAAHGEK